MTTSRAVDTLRASGPMPQNDQKRGEMRGKCSRSTGHVARTRGAARRRRRTRPGSRIEPPKSVPQSNAAIPDATAAAPPPVLPPAVRDASMRISHRAEDVVVALHRERHVAEIRLAEEHGARSLERRRTDAARLVGHARAMTIRAARRRNARGVPHVLEHVRHARERRVRLRRILQRVRAARASTARSSPFRARMASRRHDRQHGERINVCVLPDRSAASRSSCRAALRRFSTSRLQASPRRRRARRRGGGACGGSSGR